MLEMGSLLFTLYKHYSTLSASQEYAANEAIDEITHTHTHTHTHNNITMEIFVWQYSVEIYSLL